MSTLYLLVHPEWVPSLAAADTHLRRVAPEHTAWAWERDGTLDERHQRALEAAAVEHDRVLVLEDDPGFGSSMLDDEDAAATWEFRELQATFTVADVHDVLSDVRDVDHVVVAGFSRYDCVARVLDALLGEDFDDPWVAGDVTCDDALLLPWTPEAADEFAARATSAATES